MKAIKKKLLATIMAVVLACSLSMIVGAATGSFTTTQGQYNKSWNYSLTTTTVGSVLSRLTGSIEQPQKYTYDSLKIGVTLFCNGSTNAYVEKTATDEYKLSGYAEATKGDYPGLTNGSGSMYVQVSDNYYGQYSGMFYNFIQ